MAKNEIAEIIGGIFALVIFIVIGGAMITSLSQVGDSSLQNLISFVFIVSTGLIILAIVGALVKFFKDLINW